MLRLDVEKLHEIEQMKTQHVVESVKALIQSQTTSRRGRRRYRCISLNAITKWRMLFLAQIRIDKFNIWETYLSLNLLIKL